VVDAAVGHGALAVANFRLESTCFESAISTMVWRSVGNSHTEFARESAIDELAIAAGRDPVDLRRELLAGSPRTLRAPRDPVDLRRELLAGSPRTLRALELAAERADWGSPLPNAGRADHELRLSRP
jgi:isoquinoline 1-oxidoreductase beta subunit